MIPARRSVDRPKELGHIAATLQEPTPPKAAERTPAELRQQRPQPQGERIAEPVPEAVAPAPVLDVERLAAAVQVLCPRGRRSTHWEPLSSLGRGPHRRARLKSRRGSSESGSNSSSGRSSSGSRRSGASGRTSASNNMASNNRAPRSGSNNTASARVRAPRTEANARVPA